jgi:hypothetical protein
MSTTRNVFIWALTILLTSILAGCGSSARSLSDIKWQGNRIEGFSRTINNMGYFAHRFTFIFYDDGTLVFTKLPKEITVSYSPNDTIYMEQLGYCFTSYFKEEFNEWVGGANGVYKIEGDTIFANLYFRNRIYLSASHSGIPFVTYMWKLKFHILDSSTIHWVEMHQMDKEFPLPESIDDTLHFYPAEQLPPPNTEMKRKRWLWKEKKDWKDYKRMIKGTR